MKRLIPIFCLILALTLASPGLCAAEPEEEAALAAACESVFSAVLTPDMSDGEKALALHDWLALTCQYNPLDAAARDTACGAVIQHRAVCRGYARGYAFLTARAGLEGLDTYSGEIDHAWTVVTLDGSRYFSDATWDDTRAPCIGRVKHEWFAFSDAAAPALQHSGWDRDDLSVPGGVYESAPWLAAVTRVVFTPEYLYYIDDAFCLVRCGRQSWQTETLLQADESWPLWGLPAGRREGVYSGLVYLDGRLWFNTPYELVSVDMLGGDRRVEYTADTTQGVLYGLDVRDGRLVCSLATEPLDEGYTLLDTGLSTWGAWGYEPDPLGPWTELLARADAAG